MKRITMLLQRVSPTGEVLETIASIPLKRTKPMCAVTPQTRKRREECAAALIRFAESIGRDLIPKPCGRESKAGRDIRRMRELLTHFHLAHEADMVDIRDIVFAQQIDRRLDEAMRAEHKERSR